MKHKMKHGLRLWLLLSIYLIPTPYIQHVSSTPLPSTIEAFLENETNSLDEDTGIMATDPKERTDGIGNGSAINSNPLSNRTIVNGDSDIKNGGSESNTTLTSPSEFINNISTSSIKINQAKANNGRENITNTRTSITNVTNASLLRYHSTESDSMAKEIISATSTSTAFNVTGNLPLANDTIFIDSIVNLTSLALTTTLNEGITNSETLAGGVTIISSLTNSGSQLTATTPVDCFMNHTKSKSNKIGNDFNPFHENITSTKKCQEICQLVEPCAYFTYNKDNNNCMLKTDKALDAREETDKNIVFGPKFCKEDNSTQFTSETEVLARSLPTPETNTTKEKALKTTADTNAETSTEISQTSEFPLTEMTRKGCAGSCETKDGYGCCIFPFIYDRKKYHSCVHGYSGPWCAYSVDDFGVMETNQYWYCKDYCKDDDFSGYSTLMTTNEPETTTSEISTNNIINTITTKPADQTVSTALTNATTSETDSPYNVTSTVSDALLSITTMTTLKTSKKPTTTKQDATQTTPRETTYTTGIKENTTTQTTPRETMYSTDIKENITTQTTPRKTTYATGIKENTTTQITPRQTTSTTGIRENTTTTRNSTLGEAISTEAAVAYVTIPFAFLFCIFGAFAIRRYTFNKNLPILTDEFEISNRKVGRKSRCNSLVRKKSIKQTAQDKRPLTIKRILEDDIHPADEEYSELKDLDQRMHVLKFSTKIARTYLSSNLPDGSKVESRNRYRNILPYDHTRIKLMNPINHNGDYINASWLTTAKAEDNSQKGSEMFSRSSNSPCPHISFMACQGPLPNTCVDHLQMIHEQKIDVVVMLTRLEEALAKDPTKTKVKCERYWPEEVNDVFEFGHMSINNQGESLIEGNENQSVNDLIRRSLELANNMDEYVYDHSFEHIHYTGWPDFGAPDTTDSIIVMVKEVRKLVAAKAKNVKILVHCSAGVGRTGTFIALYQLMEILDNKVAEYKRLERMVPLKTAEPEKLTVDLFNTVVTLRKQRGEMVQSLAQYEFLHKCVVEYAKEVKEGFEQKIEQQEELPFISPQSNCAQHLDFILQRMDSDYGKRKSKIPLMV